MRFIHQIKELRNIVPIGISEAMSIVEANNGNVSASIAQAKANLANRLTKKMGIDLEQATATLQQANFDLDQAFEIINDRKFSKTERILQKTATSEQKAFHIYRAIVNENYEFDTYTFNEDTVSILNEPQRSFLIIIEWLEYFDYEGFFDAIHADYFENFISLLKAKLKMTDLVAALEQVQGLKSQVIAQFNQEHGLPQNYSTYFAQADQDELLATAEKLLRIEKDDLYDRALQFVAEHVKSFP